MSKPRIIAAQTVHDYMVYRAGCEGQAHTLTVEFYREALLQGTTRFFGVLVEGNKLVRDDQQPDMLRSWLCRAREKKDD